MLRHSLRVLVPVACFSLLACSSDDEGGGPLSPGVDAGSDGSADVSTDVPTVPDAAADAVMDAPSEATADGEPGDADGSQPDAAATWEGSPWYGCTPNDEPSSATVVTALDQEDQYFNPEDRRTVEGQVDFPAAGSWERIDMIVELSCPADGDCDNWDRFANVMLVENAGGADEEVFELERYMTPYNIGMCMRTDVTRFAPRLVGQKTIRSFIDTWVGPNEPVHGHGWRTTVKFVFHPGTADPAMELSMMVPLWPFDTAEIGNPDAPFAEAMGAKTVMIPSGATRVELRVVATGHGQGNRFNCAEFCPMVHELSVNGQAFSFNPWRDDCADNPIGPGQAGTWKFNRAGWCPGAYVEPVVLDVTSAVVPGEEATVTYDMYSPTHGGYENTCRPGAGDANNECELCAFTSGPGNCDYNGGNHTMPVHKVAVQALVYE